MNEPRAYYNEIDPAAAAVLRELIERNVIMSGDVDTRSIKEVQPGDLRGYTQCHFFAGGGLWSVAARLAGWPDERKLWTGSCPCQGESLAGKRLGADDPRHLWPDFYRLIRAERPAVVMGEQVAAAAGTHWLDGVCADLEVEDYAARAVDIPACAVDAPHQRNRLYWVAMDNRVGAGLEGQRRDGNESGGWPYTAGSIATPDVQLQPDTHSCGRPGRPENPQWSAEERAIAERSLLRNGSWWSDFEWIVSPLDGKARRSFTNISGMAYGLPARLAALGNDSFIGVQTEMIAYADATKAGPAEVLRKVREGVLSACSKASEESGWRPGDGLGGTEGFPASQILLSFLCEYDRRTHGGRSLLAIGADARASMRGVRGNGKSSQSSCGWEHLQQRSEQPPNSLRELSCVLARYAETIGASVGASDAKGLGFLTPSFPGRVDLWRVGGNAIVPILAAEVIAAFLETEGCLA